MIIYNYFSGVILDLGVDDIGSRMMRYMVLDILPTSLGNQRIKFDIN